MQLPEEARKKLEKEEDKSKKEPDEEFNAKLYFPVDASGQEKVCV